MAESRERVHAALHASGLALPGKRVIVNLAPQYLLVTLRRSRKSWPLLRRSGSLR
ncbi:hypothetical protein HFN56_23405 [Rhizobium leguminosarum]|nr:hypothetical protein [Rhizobium leguminosarum]